MKNLALFAVLISLAACQNTKKSFQYTKMTEVVHNVGSSNTPWTGIETTTGKFSIVRSDNGFKINGADKTCIVEAVTNKNVIKFTTKDNQWEWNESRGAIVSSYMSGDTLIVRKKPVGLTPEGLTANDWSFKFHN
jgi:hypothetical protein